MSRPTESELAPPFADPQDLSLSHANPTLIRLIVVFTALLALGMIWIIYARWYAVRAFPTSYIIPHADASLDGVEVTISSANGPELPPVKLTAQNDYTVPVLVEPGLHTVSIRLDGRVASVFTVFVPTMRGVPIALAELVHRTPSTAPTSAPIRDRAASPNHPA